MALANDMIEWYEVRTQTHIARVHKYVNKIVDKFPQFSELKQIVKSHDQSKFEEPERTPYIFITWDYRCKRDGVSFDMPKVMKEKMNKATEHHILHNKHHPEAWDENYDSSMLNRDDRDAVPDTMVDGTKMPDIYIAEMCADWMAMSEELNSVPQDWADMNVNKRWKFDENQVNLIYDILNTVWSTSDE